MEAQVASLLLIVASVAFSSIVVGFAAVTMEQTLQDANDANSSAQEYVDRVMNATQNYFDKTQNLPTNETTTGP
jgi:hypothetical protein